MRRFRHSYLNWFWGSYTPVYLGVAQAAFDELPRVVHSRRCATADEADLAAQLKPCGREEQHLRRRIARPIRRGPWRPGNAPMPPAGFLLHSETQDCLAAEGYAAIRSWAFVNALGAAQEGQPDRIPFSPIRSDLKGGTRHQ